MTDLPHEKAMARAWIAGLSPEEFLRRRSELTARSPAAVPVLAAGRHVSELTDAEARQALAAFGCYRESVR